MCGIVGYIGGRQAAPLLLEGLSRLEYRGYDSAGIAVRDGAGDTVVVKAKGRLKNLAEKTNGGRALIGTAGIGHTRWATHGEPSESNAHPHISGDDCNVVGVHNGIIENYQELREKLESHGYVFYSETDTEVCIKLIDYYYRKYGIGPVDAITRTMVRVRGSYALAVMFKDDPGAVYGARKDSPLIVGLGEGENFLASDVPAILKNTRKVAYIDNLELVRLTADSCVFYDLNGDGYEKESREIDWDAEAADRGGFEHYMIKEIHEQPKAFSDTVDFAVKGDENAWRIDLSALGLEEEEIRQISDITFVACGSAYHVGMVLQYVFEDMVRVPVRVELASEFRYRKPLLGKNTLVVAVSQSGETADTLEAIREAKSQGVKTLAIVNVTGSTIARESDAVFYTCAGPEIAVATTKAYSAQLAAGYLLAIRFAEVRGLLGAEDVHRLVAELKTIPAKMKRILEDKERLQWFASKIAGRRDMFFVGRGIDYAICMEGSLKMKEITYLHSEAYAAGELKHGTISLIENGTLVLGVMTQENLYGKTLSNIQETRTRGAYTCAVTNYGHYACEDTVDFVTYVPVTDPHFAASLAVIPLQLLAYYTAVARGLDVDKPRNLAKSVTVE